MSTRSRVLRLTSKKIALRYVALVLIVGHCPPPPPPPPTSTHNPPNVLQMISAPRPSLFFTALPLCIIPNANPIRTQTGEAWKRGYKCYISSLLRKSSHYVTSPNAHNQGLATFCKLPTHTLLTLISFTAPLPTNNQRAPFYKLNQTGISVIKNDIRGYCRYTYKTTLAKSVPPSFHLLTDFPDFWVHVKARLPDHPDHQKYEQKLNEQFFKVLVHMHSKRTSHWLSFRQKFTFLRLAASSLICIV